MRRLRQWTMVVLAGAIMVASVVGPGALPARADQGGPRYYLDVDITNQVLKEMVNGQVGFSAHISTGSEQWYWNGSDWEIAHTPRGWFEVYWRDPGWVEADLGWLYDAMYFTGGYAIHGSNSVPDYPASHGCVRVSIEEAEWLFARIEYGTPVLVHD